MCAGEVPVRELELELELELVKKKKRKKVRKKEGKPKICHKKIKELYKNQQK